MELQGVRTDVQYLRREGDARGKRLDEVLGKTLKVEGRVGTLEGLVGSHDVKIARIEKRIWQIGFLILALHGGAREVLTLFLG